MNPISKLTLRDMGDINQVRAYMLSLYDQAIAAVNAASEYVDTTAALSLINSSRAQTTALFDQLARDLPSLLTQYPLGTSLSDVFSHSYGSSGGLDFGSYLGNFNLPVFPPVSSTPPPAPAPAPAPVPGVLPDVIPIGPAPPSGDGVRIFGDTPMLLRESNPSIPSGAAFRLSGQNYISPESSTATLMIGSYQAPDINGFWGVLTDAAQISGKELIGYGMSKLPGGDFLAKASDIREIGEAQNDVLEGSMGSVLDGIRVLTGSMSMAAFEDRQERFHAATKEAFDSMAQRQIASQAPGLWGTLFGKSVELSQEVGISIKNTHSFEMSVTTGASMQGGLLGNYMVAGDQFTTIHIGGGTSVVVGGARGNLVYSGTGADTVIGGKGVDTMVYTSGSSGFSIGHSGNSITVTDGAGKTDTLERVERVVFSDKKLAFDMQGSAGNTAKMIHAAFGADFLTPAFVAEGLAAFDAGMTMKQVAQVVVGLSLFANLAGSHGNADFVDLVYENVVGALPSEAEFNLYLGMLNQGTSQADLLVAASNATLNVQHVNLVGLANSGLEFA